MSRRSPHTTVTLSSSGIDSRGRLALTYAPVKHRPRCPRSVRSLCREGGRMTPALVCRSCGAGPLDAVLSLGRTPLADALRDEASLALPEPTYPLDLAFCTACSLLQITLSVPPEQLFRDYAYFSSYADTMVRHATSLARRLVASRRLDHTCHVV